MTLRQRLRHLAGHAVVQNFLALSGVQAASYIFPLITLPYVVRVLAKDTWGLLAFVQAFFMFVVMVVEYGFVFSATRQVAEHRHDRAVLGEIVAGVHGAKAVLTVLVLVPVVAVLLAVPAFRGHPLLFWAGFTWAVMQAFHPLWFFQGIEKMRLVSGLDILARLVATVGIFVLVRRPDDAWKVLGLQALGASISAGVGLVLMLRAVPLRLPRPRLVAAALKAGFAVFLSRGAVMLYAVNNSFILGLFQPQGIVAVYAGAEKIMRPMLGMVGALGQAVFPRIAYLLRHDRQRAAPLAYKGVFLFAAGGLVVCAGVLLAAPLMVRVVLGAKFADAVPVLRILALNFPLIAVSLVLGVLWMLPLRLDKAYNAIALAAGVVNIAVAVVVAPRFGAKGMACTSVLAEFVVTAGTFALLRRRRLDPASMSQAVVAERENPKSETRNPNQCPMPKAPMNEAAREFGK